MLFTIEFMISYLRSLKNITKNNRDSLYRFHGEVIIFGGTKKGDFSVGWGMYSPQLPLAHGRVPSSSSSSSFSFDAQHADPGGLEAALLQIMHDHHHTSLRLRDQAERAKKDAIQNAARVSDLLVDAVNSGVQESFINEKRIEHEIRALAVTISRFMKLTNQWLTATRAINTAVKEIGDFENWMKTMEFDCKSITAAIQNIHQA